MPIVTPEQKERIAKEIGELAAEVTEETSQRMRALEKEASEYAKDRISRKNTLLRKLTRPSD